MKKILLVDDEPYIRTSIISLLDWESLGYEKPREAGDGKAALRRLQDEQIDIVLLDMSMPVMDGMEFLKSIEESSSSNKPQIIVLSAYNDFKLVREAFLFGIVDYVLKSEIDGFSLLDLLARAEQRDSQDYRADRMLSDDSSIEKADRHIQIEQSREMKRLALTELLHMPAQPGFSLLLKTVNAHVTLPLYVIRMWPQDYRNDAEATELHDRIEYYDNLQSVCRLVLESYGRIEFFQAGGSDCCILLSDAGEQTPDTSVMRELQTRIEQNLGIQIDCALSAAVETWAEVHLVWNDLNKLKYQCSRIVRLARRYIKDHYAQPRITLDEIAEFVGVSKNHLSWDFSKETGTTITDCIAHTRINAAAKMLMESSMLVYEVALRVGFSNVEHFSRSFKRIMGCSPSRYAGKGEG